MERTISLTEDEMRREWAIALGLDDLAEDGRDVKTFEDLMIEHKCSRASVECRTQKALAEGTMERVKVRRQCGDGRVRVLVAYRLVKVQV